jgi:hypothetical protein
MLKSCWLCVFDGWTGSPQLTVIDSGFSVSPQLKEGSDFTTTNVGDWENHLLWGHLWTGVACAHPQCLYRDLFGHPAVLFFCPPGLSCLLWCLASGKKFYKFYASDNAGVNGQQWSTGWWFGTFFMFPYIGKNNPNWLIFFRGVQTTNQSTCCGLFKNAWNSTSTNIWWAI